MSLYNANTAASISTIQSTVAASMGNNIVPSVVTVYSVTGTSSRRLGQQRLMDSSSSSTNAITITYSVTTLTPTFPSSAAAYTALTSALISAVTSGAFQQLLTSYATALGATALAASTVEAPAVSNGLNAAPTPAPNGSSETLSGGAIAGIVIGCVVAVALAAAGGYYGAIMTLSHSKDFRSGDERAGSVVKATPNPMSPGVELAPQKSAGNDVAL